MQKLFTIWCSTELLRAPDIPKKMIMCRALQSVCVAGPVRALGKLEFGGRGAPYQGQQLVRSWYPDANLFCGCYAVQSHVVV